MFYLLPERLLPPSRDLFKPIWSFLHSCSWKRTIVDCPETKQLVAKQMRREGPVSQRGEEFESPGTKKSNDALNLKNSHH